MKILVVEDNPRHLEDARNFFASQQEVDADYVSTLYDAEAKLRSGQYEGLISDIFFPTGGSEEYRIENSTALMGRIKPRIQRCQEAVRKSGSQSVWEIKSEVALDHLSRWKDDVIPPCGLQLLDVALELNMPTVFNTDRFHHDAEVEFVLAEANEKCAKKEGWFFLIVESGHSDVVPGESLSKDFYIGPRPGNNKYWADAWKRLRLMVDILTS